MDPTKGAPKVTTMLLAQGGHVDLFAEPTSAPASSFLQPDGMQPLSDRLSGTDRRFMDHPLFRDNGSVISRIKKNESWMCFNALQLLGLYGIEEIAKSELRRKLFVAVKFDRRSWREIRGFELRPDDSKQEQDKCLLTIRREREFIAFDDVYATGLPADVAEWVGSLKGRMIKEDKYTGEIETQERHNEEAFRTFYHEGLEGLDPESYSILHAWVALGSGRILCVRGLPYPTETNDGVPTTFMAKIIDGAARLSCTNLTVLNRMPSMYFAYFREPFIMIRDVIRGAEEDLEVEVEVETLPGEGPAVLDDVDDATGGLIA